MRFLGTLALVFLAPLLAAESALACSCAFAPPMQKLGESDGAVVARLLEVRPIDDGDDTQSSADPTDYIYRTGRVVKGRLRLRKGRRLVVRSVRFDASCGLSSTVGELTGLFLTRDGGRWTSGTCQQIAAGEMRRLGRSQSAAAGSAATCGA